MQSMKKNFKKLDKQAYEKIQGWIKRKWKLLLFLMEIAILIFAGISYYRHVNNLICYEYPEEQLMQYTDEMYFSCFGGAIDESYSAGLYNVIPEQEMLLRKGYYRYTLSYESTSEGSFCWPHSYNTFYNVMDEAVIYFENGVHETEEEFWLNVDLNVALRLSYNGTGTVKLTGFTIEETPVAANIRLFAVVIFLFGLNVILGLWIYNKKHVISAERRYVFAALLTISLVASYPLLLGYAILGHDFYFHLTRIEGIKDGILSGQFPVRINPTFYDGYGYANSIFYGEILLYIPALLRLVGFRLTTCYNIFGILINVLTCFGSYYCFQKMFKNTLVAVTGTFLYVMAPYRLMDMYIRAAVGEYSAMLFLPFVAYGMFRIYTEDTEKKEYKWCFLPLVLGLTGIIQSHVLTGEMTGGLILLVCVLLLFLTLQKKRLWALVKTVFFTLLVNAWFLVPFADFALTQKVRITQASSGALIQKTGVFIPQLMGMFSVYSWVNRDAGDGIADEMTLFLGIALFLGMLLCTTMLFVVGKEESKRKRQAGFFLLISVLAAWMSTVYFPWDKICTMFPKIESWVTSFVASIQFTWRFLILATALATIATGFGLRMLYQKEGKQTCMTIAVALCLLTGIGGMRFMYDCVNNQSPLVINSAKSYNTTQAVSHAEYTLVNASYEAVTEIFEPRAYGDIIVDEYEKQGTNIKLSVRNSGEDSYVLLPLLNYKGYSVSSEDKVITSQNLTRGEGAVMQINIPAGYSGRINVKYRGFWYWRVAELITVASVGYLIWIVWKNRKRKLAVA